MFFCSAFGISLPLALSLTHTITEKDDVSFMDQTNNKETPDSTATGGL